MARRTPMVDCPVDGCQNKRKADHITCDECWKQYLPGLLNEQFQQAKRDIRWAEDDRPSDDDPIERKMAYNTAIQLRDRIIEGCGALRRSRARIRRAISGISAPK